MTKTRTLLAAVALTAGMTMVLDGCAPHASTPVAKVTLAPVVAKPAAGNGAKLASMSTPVVAPEGAAAPAPKPVAPPKPAVKTVSMTKPKLATGPKPQVANVKPCVRKVRRMVGNGKGANYSQKSWTCEGTTS